MAEVIVKGTHLSLSDCWFYPLTGSRVTLGTREVLTIFRIISDQDLEQECSTYSAEGLRVSGARPRRYDHVVEEAEMKWSGAPETPTALVEHFRSVTATGLPRDQVILQMRLSGLNIIACM